MDWKLRLVADYIAADSILQTLESFSGPTKQSNNQTQGISDAEVVAIYMNGLRCGFRTVKNIHAHFWNFLRSWFPSLPRYEQFLKRLNNLGKALRLGCYLLGKERELQLNSEVAVIDSMPVELAAQPRSSRARVAPDLANKGYNSSKDKYYYGVKIHAVVGDENKAPYLPVLIVVTPASTHDINVLKHNIEELDAKTIIGDKAYTSAELAAFAQQIGKIIKTPVKKPKGRELSPEIKAGNTELSRTRQVVESAFAWLQNMTGVHSASKVRSSQGLLRHLYGAITTAMVAPLLYEVLN